jgi:hypothetical protein
MNILTLIIFIILVFILVTKKEYFNFFQDYLNPNYSKSNLAALSRNELQSPPTIDLSKIDWSKVDDYTYSQIVCLIQGCDEKAIIKNLPISTP